MGEKPKSRMRRRTEEIRMCRRALAELHNEAAALSKRIKANKASRIRWVWKDGDLRELEAAHRSVRFAIDLLTPGPVAR